MERLDRQENRIHAVDSGVMVRPLRLAGESHRRPGYRCSEERAWQEATPQNAGQACLYLYNVAFHAVRSGWDIIGWHGQPNILRLIAERKNAALLGVAA